MTMGEFHLAENEMNQKALQKEREELKKELDDSVIRSERIFEIGKITSDFDKVAFMKEIDYQKSVQKRLDELDGKTYPLYYEDYPAVGLTLLKSIALTVADVDKEVWYNKNQISNAVLTEMVSPILFVLSLGNQLLSTALVGLKRTLNPENDKNDANILGAKGSGFNKDGYIVNQRALMDNKTSVGYGLGSSPANGCGWISVYNAMKMLKGEVDPYGIMREVEDGAFLLGTAGTDPLFIRNYFSKNGYDAQIYFTRDDVQRNAPQSDACIWVYGWYDKSRNQIGAHFVACKPEGGNQMTFYNSGIGDITTKPLQEHYLDTDLFRLMICIKKR